MRMITHIPTGNQYKNRKDAKKNGTLQLQQRVASP